MKYSVLILVFFASWAQAQEKYQLVYEKSIQLLEIPQNADTITGGYWTRVHSLDDLDSAELNPDSKKVVDTTFYLSGLLVTKNSKQYFKKRYGRNSKTRVKLVSTDSLNFFIIGRKKYASLELENLTLDGQLSRAIDWYLITIDKPVIGLNDILNDNHFVKVYSSDTIPTLYLERLNNEEFQTYSYKDVWWGDFVNIDESGWKDFNLTSVNTELGGILAFQNDRCEVYSSGLANGYPVKTSYSYEIIPNMKPTELDILRDRLLGTWESESFKFYPDTIKVENDLKYIFSFDSTNTWNTEVIYSQDTVKESHNYKGQLWISHTGNHISNYIEGGIIFHFHEFIDDKLKVKIDKQNHALELLMIKQKDSNKR